MLKRARYLISHDRKPSGATGCESSLEAKAFRSDNGRRQFLMESAWVVALTGPSYAFVNEMGVPSDYSAVAIIPGIAFFIFSRSLTWWNRKRGKRFSAYDYNDFNGD